MQIRNARWDSADQTQIVCELMLDDGPLAGQWIPFRAMKTDPVAYGQAIFEDLAAGKYGAIAAQGTAQ